MKTKITLILIMLVSIIMINYGQDTIFVPQDYPTIQQGIDAASDNNIVLVDTGTWNENINFIGKAITVASKYILDSDTNFINNTIINGSMAAGLDTASTVLFISGEDTTSVLCGFTITGGTGLAMPSPWPRLGGGICMINSGGKITHNLIAGNSVSHPSSAAGGGIFCGNDGGEFWLIIQNNTINENSVTTNDLNAWGGGISIECNARISENIIHQNQVTSGANNAAGGGIYCFSYDGSPNFVTISHNTISENDVDGAGAYGGGIFINNTAALVYQNELSLNETTGNNCGGAGIFTEPGSEDIAVTSNLIEGNYNNAQSLWLGGGIAIPDPVGTAQIYRNEIRYNGGSDVASAGGGIFFQEADDFLIDVNSNIIESNYAHTGGGGFYARRSYNIYLANNIFIENISANTGGAVNLFEPAEVKCRATARPVMVNNTFSGNEASGQGGAIWCAYAEANPVTFNNIFWQNEAGDQSNDIYYSGTENMLVSYSDVDTDSIEGVWEGAYNFTADPGFYDTICHINETSPCVDSAADSVQFQGTWYNAPGFDIDGGIRPYGQGLIDIGADENDIFTAIPPIAPPFQNSTFNIQLYPNPTGGDVDCRLDDWTILDTRIVGVAIFDLHGREVMRIQERKLPAGDHSFRIDLSALPDGVYFVRVMAGEEMASKKLVLIH